jgi:hypothetical protein
VDKEHLMALASVGRKYNGYKSFGKEKIPQSTGELYKPSMCF